MDDAAFDLTPFPSTSGKWCARATRQARFDGTMAWSAR